MGKSKSSNIYELFPFFKESADAFFMRKIIPHGTVVFDEGDECGGVVFVLDGSIRVSKVGSNGREVILYRLGSGDSCILTIASVLSDLSYPATATVENDAEVILLPVQQFKRLLAVDAGLQKYIYKLISTRLLEVMTLIDDIIFRRIDDRLIEFLLKEADKDGDIIKMTHEELAIHLGTAREVISRVMKELERNGYVQLSRGKVRVISRSRLAEKLSDC